MKLDANNLLLSRIRMAMVSNIFHSYKSALLDFKSLEPV